MREDEDVKRAYEAIKDEGIEYPEYYLKTVSRVRGGEFVLASRRPRRRGATYSMALRVWPKARDGGDGATAIERFVHGRDQGTSRDAR